MKKLSKTVVVCFVLIGMLVGSGFVGSSASHAADSKFEDVIAGKGKGLKVGITVSDLISIYISSAAEYTKRLLELSGAEVIFVNC